MKFAGDMGLKILTNQTQSFFVNHNGGLRWGRIVLLILGVVFLGSLLNRGSGPSSSGSVLKLQTQQSAPARPATVNAPSQTQDVLSCQSIKLYERFAGDFDRFFVHHDGTPLSQEYLDNFGDGKKCELVLDAPAPLTKLYHVEKIETGYLCVRKVNEPQCRWTDASKLRYIGHGPQLSDEQFARVEKLFAEADRLFKMAKAYSERLDKIYDENGEGRRLDPRQERDVDELNDLYGKALRQAHDLQQQALKIGSE